MGSSEDGSGCWFPCMVNAEEGDGAPSAVVWVDGVLLWEYTGSQTHKGQG